MKSTRIAYGLSTWRDSWPSLPLPYSYWFPSTGLTLTTSHIVGGMDGGVLSTQQADKDTHISVNLV